MVSLQSNEIPIPGYIKAEDRQAMGTIQDIYESETWEI